MSEFKVGDRVRVTAPLLPYEGEIGMVAKVADRSSFPIEVGGFRDSDLNTCAFGASELALLESPCEESVAASFPEDSWETSLHHILGELGEMMAGRHKKYGPGNIAKHGPAGILVRMDDKFARLESGQGNFDDETIENTLDDIIGYAIIWKMWVRGEWPGSPVARKDISD